MKRFILTGAPGAGKTAILRQLELEGFGVVEEAATDVIALAQAQGIAEPWTHPAFIDSIADLQRQRLARFSAAPDALQFHDRSIFCTVALAAYLDHPLSDRVSRDLEQVSASRIYESKVFFIRNLGFVQATDARRISFEESLRFERIHEETYRRFGFHMVFIGPGPLPARVAALKAELPCMQTPTTTQLPHH